MNGPTTVLILFAMCATPSLAAEVQVGRYSLKEAVAAPAQRDLLAVIIDTSLPRELHTVGEALQYLLRRSGYRLATSATSDPVMTRLAALELPAVHRHLGPIRLRDALAALAGPAYELHEEPVDRRLYFTVRDAYRDASSPHSTAPNTGSREAPESTPSPPAPQGALQLQDEKGQTYSAARQAAVISSYPAQDTAS